MGRGRHPGGCLQSALKRETPSPEEGAELCFYCNIVPLLTPVTWGSFSEKAVEGQS